MSRWSISLAAVAFGTLLAGSSANGAGIPAKPTPKTEAPVAPAPVPVAPAPVRVVPVPVAPVQRPERKPVRRPVPKPVHRPVVDTVIQDCATEGGYEVTGFENPRQGDSDLWLLGIYETHSEHGGGSHPMGSADLKVTAPGSHIVAVASYEPVTWNFSIDAGSQVEAIYVFGYHEQVVQGVGDIPVTFVSRSARGYKWPNDRTREMVDAVEKAAGQQVHHFEGCYRASEFLIAGR